MPNLIASVIVINYDLVKYISDCLTSLEDQDIPRKDYEIIFADNGSRDRSVDVVRNQFPNVRLITFDRNYGFSEGNNRAVEYANGKYIVFLNVDTVVHRKWLSELVKAVKSEEAVKACQSNMLMPWVNEFEIADRKEFPNHTYYYDLSRFGYAAYKIDPFQKESFQSMFLEGGSLLIERELIKYPNYAFDTSLGSYGEDLDLALRLNILGYKTVTVPTSVVFHYNSFAMKAGSDIKSIQKSIQIIRNRILAYYNNMTNLEFMLILPLLLIGAPLKVRELGWSLRKQLLYGIGSIPVTFIGLYKALMKLSKFKGKRRHNLKQRKLQELQLLRKII